MVNILINWKFVAYGTSFSSWMRTLDMCCENVESKTVIKGNLFDYALMFEILYDGLASPVVAMF